MKKEEIIASDGDPLFRTLEFNVTDVVWSQDAFRELVRLWDKHYVIVKISYDRTFNLQLTLRKGFPETVEIRGQTPPDFGCCDSMVIHWRAPHKIGDLYYETLINAVCKGGYILQDRFEWDSKKNEALYVFRLKTPAANIFGILKDDLEKQEEFNISMNHCGDRSKELGAIRYLESKGYKQVHMDCDLEKSTFCMRRSAEV